MPGGSASSWRLYFAGLTLGECLSALAEIFSMISRTTQAAFWFNVRFLFNGDSSRSSYFGLRWSITPGHKGLAFQATHLGSHFRHPAAHPNNTLE